MKRVLLCLTALLLAVPCWAVDITPPEGDLAAGTYFQLKIGGVTQANLSKSHVIFFPRDGVEVTPLLTWDGTPLLWCRCTKAGNYLFAIASGDEYAETVLSVGGSNDGDDDDGDDNSPLPAGRFVLVLAETSTRTASQAATIAKVQAYCKSKGIPWRVEDPDQKGSWIAKWKETIAQSKQAIPVLVVAAVNEDGSTAQSWIVPLPATGAEAITAIQEHGG